MRKLQVDYNLNGKAILLTDNVPNHTSETQPISDNGEIITMFLPRNCATLIQLMDQNALTLNQNVLSRKPVRRKMTFRKTLRILLLRMPCSYMPILETNCGMKQ